MLNPESMNMATFTPNGPFVAYLNGMFWGNLLVKTLDEINDETYGANMVLYVY